MQIEKYLPQRPPVLLIHEVLAFEQDGIVCSVDWKKLSFFQDEMGRLIPSVMPEMITQASAIMNGLNQEGTAGPPGLGMFTALKEFCILGLPIEEAPLRVTVKVDAVLGPHQIVEGRISQGDALLAHGLIFLYNKTESERKSE